jgi:hypothetical protein
MTAIEECRVCLVFWSNNAGSSTEVRMEYQRAVELGKEVVPVLLDTTAMPAPLAEYQAIDLRPALARAEQAHSELNRGERGKFDSKDLFAKAEFKVRFIGDELRRQLACRLGMGAVEQPETGASAIPFIE